MNNWRGWLIGAISAVFLLAALLVPAIPQPLSITARHTSPPVSIKRTVMRFEPLWRTAL